MGQEVNSHNLCGTNNQTFYIHALTQYHLIGLFLRTRVFIEFLKQFIFVPCIKQVCMIQLGMPEYLYTYVSLGFVIAHINYENKSVVRNTWELQAK